MPRRPTKKWWKACTAGVAKSGTAIDPAAICGATWARKSRAKRAAVVREENRLVGHRYEVRGKGRGGKPRVLATHQTQWKSVETANSLARKYPGKRFGVFDRKMRRYVGFSHA